MARRRSLQDPPVRDLSIRSLVAVALVVLVIQAFAPVAVQAVGSVVGIVDADSDTDLARVDSGKLRVGDGVGNLTVDGQVIPVHHPISNTFTAGLDTAHPAIVFPGGGVPGPQRLLVTSLIVNNVGSATVDVVIRSTSVASSASCSSSPTGGVLLRARLSIGETNEFLWPEVTPFQLFAPTISNRLCAQVSLISPPDNTSIQFVLTYYLESL
jgi:hypothetical protein